MRAITKHSMAPHKIPVLSSSYYQSADLKNAQNIGDFQKPFADKFFAYYGEASKEGAITACEKTLIALAVSHTAHVAAAIREGASLVHGVQMMKRTKRIIDAMKTLLYQRDPLSSSEKQIEILSAISGQLLFESKLRECNLFPLKPTQIEIFQINVGKQCNQTCKHCHVDAGPDRKEMMSRDTIEQCLAVLRKYNIPTVDITGGAPEMHPLFRWFVESCSLLNKEIIVRCNLTIILANKKFYDLPEFYKKHKVQVICSLPFYNADRTDRQRGEGVFEKSIEALKMLNAQGYGMENSDLKLNLVYNPSGAFLPADQLSLERQFKERLFSDHGIYFNNLFTIANMPISRFLDFLIKSGNLEGYMERLIQAFNPSAARGVMCRNTISVGWDGSLYDCDFNQMLDLKVDQRTAQRVSDFDLNSLNQREIVVNQHCFGCTAGAGSSCGGKTT